MELKTFKDIDLSKLEFREKRTSEYLIENLRQEAIKWVEFLETPPVSFEDEKTIEWIKCFFNIELKGGKLQ